MNTWRYCQPTLATLCLLLLPLLSLNQAHGLEVTSCQLEATRLSRRVLPKHYKLEVHTFRSDTNNFEGHVEIDISLNNEPKHDDSMLAKTKTLPGHTQRIILHADKDLSINDVIFKETNGEAEGEEIEVRGICRDSDRGLVGVDLAREPNSRHGHLGFNFTGLVYQEAQAIFDASKSTRQLITTRLQPAMARKAFPCFDELDLKASFEVSIVLPSKLTALSNMKPAKTEALKDELEGFKRVRFCRTPAMSTYSLAFAAGEFGHIEAQSGGVEIALWTPPGTAQSYQSRLKLAVDGYAELLDYFQMGPTLEKIDVVTLPNVNLASSYLGIITIEETFVLPDDLDFINDDSKWLLLTLMQSLASQCFGNLITMKRLDEMWLNTGLARWIARATLSKIRPLYDSQMSYLHTSISRALFFDALKSRSHSEVQTVGRIKPSSEAISSEKAECLIKMLESYVGPANFKQGLRNYISKNLHANTDAEDLWSILEEVSGKGVAKLMHSWLSQAGHPLVEVSLSGRKLIMKQRKFPPPGRPSALESNDDSLWIIPMTILISDCESGELSTQHFELSQRYGSTDLPACFDPAKHWLKLNAHFEGFYQVRYEPQLYKALGEPIMYRQLPAADRLNLLDEAQALFRSNLMGKYELRNMVSWFRYEGNEGVITGLIVPDHILRGVNKDDKIGLDTLLHYYEQNGRLRRNPRDGYLKVSSRAEVLTYLVQEPRVASVIRDCYNEYKSLRKTGLPVPGPFREAIYAAVALKGTDEEVEHLITVDIASLPDLAKRKKTCSAVLELLKSSQRWQRVVEIQNHLALLCEK